MRQDGRHSGRSGDPLFQRLPMAAAAERNLGARRLASTERTRSRCQARVMASVLARSTASGRDGTGVDQSEVIQRRRQHTRAGTHSAPSDPRRFGKRLGRGLPPCQHNPRSRPIGVPPVMAIPGGRAIWCACDRVRPNASPSFRHVAHTPARCRRGKDVTLAAEQANCRHVRGRRSAMGLLLGACCGGPPSREKLAIILESLTGCHPLHRQELDLKAPRENLDERQPFRERLQVAPGLDAQRLHRHAEHCGY